MAKVQKISGYRLTENNSSQEFNIEKQCLEHDNNMLQERNMEKQGMA